MKIRLTFIIFVFTASSAIGMNLSFLEESVLSEFSGAEIDAFRSYVREELDILNDQEIAEWQSEDSNVGGKLKPKFTYTMGGETCRRTAFLFTEQERREQYQFDVCLTEGVWGITPSPVGRITDDDWVIMTVTGTRALEIKGEEGPLSWHNSESGNSGVFMALDIEQQGEKECRKLAISIWSGSSLSSGGIYLFCKTAENGWEREIEEF